MNIPIEAIAKVCHQANKAYCETIGDTSQKDWVDVLEWQKESAIKGVEYRIKNIGCTAEDIHESWLAERKANGWTYGKVKDVEKKTHPCFVPYKELPKKQQKKDVLFSSIIHALTLPIDE